MQVTALRPNKALREARERLGLSQAQLAEKLGPKIRISGVTIGHYETGRAKPDRERRDAIAKLLKIDPKKIAVTDRTLRGSSASRATKTEAVSRSIKVVGTQRGKTSRDASLMVIDPDEVAALNALRAMKGATRRVVLNMILAAQTPV